MRTSENEVGSRPGQPARARRGLASAAVLLLAVACGDKFEALAPGCESEVGSCAPGTTCWLVEDGSRYDCLPSGQGQPGAGCVADRGQPTCGDGLFCRPPTGDGAEQCAFQCSDSADCADGEVCYAIRFEDTPLRIRACGPERQ